MINQNSKLIYKVLNSDKPNIVTQLNVKHNPPRIFKESSAEDLEINMKLNKNDEEIKDFNNDE